MDKQNDLNIGNVFSPAQTRRASEIVYEQIRVAIVDGELPAGDKLPGERQLAGLYGRSHATIREALRMLESGGYIEVIPGGGATIRQLSPQSAMLPLQNILTFRNISLEEILGFLSEAEPAFVQRAVEAATEQQIEDIRLAYEMMERCKEDALAFFDALLAFHTVAMKAANSVLLDLIWNALYGKISAADGPPMGENYYPGSQQARSALTETYYAVLMAFRERDAGKAACLIKKCWEQETIFKG